MMPDVRTPDVAAARLPVWVEISPCASFETATFQVPAAEPDPTSEAPTAEELVEDACHEGGSGAVGEVALAGAAHVSARSSALEKFCSESSRVFRSFQPD